jgi:nitrogen regulatory protein PII
MMFIKAYVRLRKAQAVVRALEKNGCTDFSTVELRGIAQDLRRKDYSYSEKLDEQYERIMSFEIVCRDENAQRLADAILKEAQTGHPGDGMIFMWQVNEAIRIRTGERSHGSLPL